MATVKFDDYLNAELRDEDFKEGFLKEKAVLESSLAVYLARQNAGLSQRELAQLSKVPQSTIARIERGDNTRIDTISKIATALGKRLTITIQ
ncbi:helix-turn-helix transcriptional regulator [Erysipelotrichaceae bacterium RD49]|nr:helix-turn-helix transcriptional regulator [Erysipelotrichaceae bacterium RD49]